MVQEANTDEPINTERDPQVKNQDHKQSQQTRHILNEDQPTPDNTTQFNLIIDI